MYIPLTFEGGFSKCLFASGGYEGYFLSGSQQWKYHWFTGSAQLTVQKGTIDNAQIYVIGGAGGGASQSTGQAGAGGGGGVNINMNTRLFGGTYNVVVGIGGLGAGAPDNPGDSGTTSSFIGSNINIIAGGGGGGNYGFGFGTERGGTSGNGLLGALNTATLGGGGGGAAATGSSITGGVGITTYIGNYPHTFGCGGGGAKNETIGGNAGFSCSDFLYGKGGKGGTGQGSGAPFYGMGGGGADGGVGGNGSSGSVIIQYPIYDYCSEYYNETGSCGCRELTFDITSGTGFNPTGSGSYIYTQCGTNKLISGSVQAYYPITVCATSGTFYSGPASDIVYNWGFLTGSITYSECATGSNCGTIPTYQSTCSSSYTTYFNTTTSNNAIYYVPRNGTQIAYKNMTQQSGSYICSSDNYPSGSTTPNVVAVPGVKCFNLRYQRTITPSIGTQILYWYDCSNTLRSQSFSYPGTNTFDFTASFATSGPWMTTNFASWTTLQYLSTASDYTGSVPTCGCP